MTCSICGASVDDEVKHKKWHKSLRKRLEAIQHEASLPPDPRHWDPTIR